MIGEGEGERRGGYESKVNIHRVLDGLFKQRLHAIGGTEFLGLCFDCK